MTNEERIKIDAEIDELRSRIRNQLAQEHNWDAQQHNWDAQQEHWVEIRRLSSTRTLVIGMGLASTATATIIAAVLAVVL